MAHFELAPGRCSQAVRHRTVEELWYVIAGETEMWRCQDGRETVVALRPGAPTDSDAKRLVSYEVSTAEQPSAAEVRKRLRAVLAGHMVPEAVVFVKALPRTDRGKLDRSALPEPPAIGGPETYGPMSYWEQAAADLWAGALELPSEDPDNDFFELGGDSLAAEAILSSTIADLGVPAAQVTATVLTEAPTVRQFAARVQRAPDALGALLVPLFLSISEVLLKPYSVL